MRACFVLLAMTAAAAANPLEPLARFAGGEWVAPAAGVRVVYEWGIGKRVLVSRTYQRGFRGETQLYQSYIFWHPEKESLYGWGVDAAGRVIGGEMTADGTGLSASMAGIDSRYAFEGDDRLRLTAKRGGAVVFTLVYERRKEARPAPSAQPAPASVRLDLLDPLLGTWRGPTTRTRLGNAFGGRLVVRDTWAAGEDGGTERHAAQGAYTWDAGKEKVVFFEWPAEGGLVAGEAHGDDAGVVFECTAREGGQTRLLRRHASLDGEDACVWKLHRRDGDAWVEAGPETRLVRAKED